MAPIASTATSRAHDSYAQDAHPRSSAAMRAPYAPPSLQTFGDIRTLTTKVGSKGKTDGFFSRRKTGF